MDFSDRQNLEQVDALAHAQRKTQHNQEVLAKRITALRRKIAKLRRDASLREGKVANHLMETADRIERELARIL